MISHEPDIGRKGLGFVRFKLHTFLTCLDIFMLVLFGTFCCCAQDACQHEVYWTPLLATVAIYQGHWTGHVKSPEYVVRRCQNFELWIKTVALLHNISSYIILYTIYYQTNHLMQCGFCNALQQLGGGQRPDRHPGWKCRSKGSHDRMRL